MSAPLLIAGMHRSGTSLVGSLVSQLGVDLGHDLVPADRNNARGYHGNALMAKTALRDPFALRLWGERQWFSDDEQPRLGERIIR